MMLLGLAGTGFLVDAIFNGDDDNDANDDGSSNDDTSGNDADDANVTGNLIEGGNGDDTLIGTQKSDYIDGKGGNDLIAGSDLQDFPGVTPASYDGGIQIVGVKDDDAPDTLIGGNGDDTIHAAGEDVVITGEGADDVIVSLEDLQDRAPETMVTIEDFDDKQDRLAISFAEYSRDDHDTLLDQTILPDGAGTIVSLNGVEAAFLKGVEGVDPSRISVQLQSDPDETRDMSGDVYTRDSYSMDGTDGDDVLIAGEFVNDVNAHDGDDRIVFSGPRGEVSGGKGDDVIHTHGRAVVYAGEGDDTIHSRNEFEHGSALIGGEGDDLFIIDKEDNYYAILDENPAAIEQDTSANGRNGDDTFIVKRTALINCEDETEGRDVVRIDMDSYVDHVAAHGPDNGKNFAQIINFEPGVDHLAFDNLPDGVTFEVTTSLDRFDQPVVNTIRVGGESFLHLVSLSEVSDAEFDAIFGDNWVRV